MDSSLQSLWMIVCLSFCCVSIGFLVLSATVTRWISGTVRSSVRDNQRRFRSRYDLDEVFKPRRGRRR